jgi:hypothetical protein
LLKLSAYILEGDKRKYKRSKDELVNKNFKKYKKSLKKISRKD